MNVKIRNDQLSDVSAGRVDNEEFWFKFGEGEVDTSLTTLWSGSAVQSGLYEYPTTAIKMYLESSSSSDTDQSVAIGGIDKNWKLQSEVIELNGTTPVASVYEYLAIFRLSVVGGSDLAGTVLLQNQAGDKLYGHIDNGGEQVNQSQMVIYPVPAGHSLFIKRLSITKLDSEPCKIFGSIKEVGKYGTDTPFRAQLNYNLSANGVIDETPHPFPISEKTYLEFRGIATTQKTTDIAVNLWGHLERNNSVPIDLENFALTAGDGQITVSWDEQTPAETSDAKGFIIEWSDTNQSLGSVLLPGTDSSYVITGLTNGTEYTVTAKWVGYDDLTSTVESDTATPAVPAAAMVVGSIIAAPSVGTDPTNSAYAYSDDEGATWSVENALTGFVMTSAGKAGDNIVALFEDASEVADGQTGYFDGSTWTYDDSADMTKLQQCGDIILRIADGALESSTDGESWSETTGSITDLNSGSNGVKVGSNYVAASSSVISSTDTLAWSALTNQPTAWGTIAGSSTRLLAANGEGETTITYYYTDDNGATSWSNGGASSITATNLVGLGSIYWNGKFYVIAIESDYSAGYFESSTDGSTWSAESIPGTGLVPLGIGTDGTNLYLSLGDLVNDDIYIAVNDGMGFDTPVLVQDGGGTLVQYVNSFGGIS